MEANGPTTMSRQGWPVTVTSVATTWVTNADAWRTTLRGALMPGSRPCAREPALLLSLNPGRVAGPRRSARRSSIPGCDPGALSPDDGTRRSGGLASHRARLRKRASSASRGFGGAVPDSGRASLAGDVRPSSSRCRQRLRHRLSKPSARTVHTRQLNSPAFDAGVGERGRHSDSTEYQRDESVQWPDSDCE